MSLPTIVIIGRRNVGKSALFNRLIEQDKAIVSDLAGTTRDRTEGICRWRGERLRIVDTGGLDIGKGDTIDLEVVRQVRFAMKEADLILFLVDARVGATPADVKLAKELRAFPAKRSAAPRVPQNGTQNSAPHHAPNILLIANKAETAKLRLQAQDPKWKNLGFGIPLSISAMTGQGVGDLLDEILTRLKLSFVASDKAKLWTNKPDLKISIIGKPNVGKSSLLNKILGEERVIVSPIPHTTREPQDTLLTYHAAHNTYHVLLIDTAGIRRKARITPGIEQAGVSKTLNVIEKSDVVLFLIDGTKPLDSQDKRLAGMIEEKGVGVIVIVNKWDILPHGQTKTGDELKKTVHSWLPGLDFAEVIFISALTGHNVDKILPLALSAHTNRKRTISDEELAELLPKLVKRHRPARAKGNTKFPIIRRLTQVAIAPPTFVAWIGPKQSLHQTYLRFIENQLRKYFEFTGTPVRVFARQEKK